MPWLPTHLVKELNVGIVGIRDLQAKNDATDNKFVTLWLHLKGNGELLSSSASI